MLEIPDPEPSLGPRVAPLPWSLDSFIDHDIPILAKSSVGSTAATVQIAREHGLCKAGGVE